MLCTHPPPPSVLNLTGIVTILQSLGLQRRLKSMNMAQSFRMRWIFITLKMKWPAIPKSGIYIIFLSYYSLYVTVDIYNKNEFVFCFSRKLLTYSMMNTIIAYRGYIRISFLIDIGCFPSIVIAFQFVKWKLFFFHLIK